RRREMAMAASLGNSRAPAAAVPLAARVGLAENTAARLWLQVSLVVLAIALPTAFAAALDGRTLDGVSVWAKPLKFQLAVPVHFVTLAAVASLLSDRVRHGRLLMVTAWASAAAGLFEIAYITAQAARGRH